MATVQIPEDNRLHAFSYAEEQQLLDDDAAAFGSVTGILLFVVSAGLLLGMLSVLLILLGL